MIIIEVLKKDANGSQEELACLQDKGAIIIESKGIEGSQETVQIFVELAKTILPSILAFVVARYEAKRYIAIKHNGIEVSGITKHNAIDVLTKIMDADIEKAKVLQARSDAQKTKAEADRQKAEAEKIRAEADKIKAEAEKIRAETAKTGEDVVTF